MQQPTDDSIGSMLGGVARSTLFGYFWDDAKTESLLNISESSKDLSVISIKEKKNNYLRKLSLSYHKNRGDIGSLYCHFTDNGTVLCQIVDLEVNSYQARVAGLFVPKFYHDRASRNF